MSKRLKELIDKFGKENVLKAFLKIQKQIAEDMRQANAQAEKSEKEQNHDDDKKHG